MNVFTGLHAYDENETNRIKVPYFMGLLTQTISKLTYRNKKTLQAYMPTKK